MSENYHADLTGANLHPPGDHAETHTDGSDDVQSATGSQKGLATAAQITKLNAIEAGADATPDASTTAKGKIEIATQAEVNTGTDTVRAVTPDTLSNYTGLGGGWTAVDASEIVKGIAELATQAETDTGTDDTRIVTPLKLANSGLISTPDATETVKGKAEIATQAETNAGTDDQRIVTPLKLKTNVDLHINDATDAHDASAVSFSPTGTIAATDVQSAIAEVASEAGAAVFDFLITLSADRTNSTTTFSDITDLSFSVSSGTMYRFEAKLYYTTPGSTIGMFIAGNGPASPTDYVFHATTFTTGTNNSGSIAHAGQTAYDETANQFGGTMTPQNIMTIQGFIRPSSSGTFALRFRSETASQTVTVKAGSYLKHW